MQAATFALALSTIVGITAATSDARVAGRRTLIVFEDSTVKQSHSQFFDTLRDVGHELRYASVSDQDLALEEYGDYLFDNIVLMAPNAQELGSVDVKELLAFVDNGGNLFVVGDHDLGEPIRELAAECGVDFDDAESLVLDHFQHDSTDEGDHARIVIESIPDLPHVNGGAAVNPVVFEGIGQAIDADNYLVVKALVGAPTSYSAVPHEPISGFPLSAGSDTILATGVQARNNARMAFVGSMYMLSNEAFEAGFQVAGSTKDRQANGNRDFSQNLLRWTFQLQGVLRAHSVQHGRYGGEGPEHQLVHPERRDLPRSIYPDPEIAREALVYRIKDDIEYKVKIEQLSGDEWVPYVADDVQLEFVMMDPYVRVTMNSSADGEYSGIFKAPDSYGIFHFRVLYRRPGLTVLFLRDQVSVRPFLHNEYERFISSAFPYYTAAFTLMAGFFVLGFFFLYHEDKPKSE